MITSMLLPAFVSAIALFFASFLMWMVLPFHRKDWSKLKNEDEFLDTVKAAKIEPGSYMFPACANQSDMKSEEFQKKQKENPNGIITVFPDSGSMGKNLGFTFAYFLVVSFCLGYLGTLGLDRGATFREVFRFMMTAGFLAFLTAIVQHSIWFKCRIVGHIIESIFYAAIVGAIFGWLWPSAT